MKIKKIILENFRSYKDKTEIGITDFTAFVGRNDIGKSTILEALDIFFNDTKANKKVESSDVNVESRKEGNLNISISVEFSDVPDSIVIDETNSTTLADEYLLTQKGTLLIEKIYHDGGKPKVYIIANHPTNANCRDLLDKKVTELKTISNDLQISDNVDRTKKADMRKAIYQYYHDSLDLCPNVEIEASNGDTKSIWEKILPDMPIYSLFQADRSNGDSDKEVQDPLKEAVKAIMKDTSVADLCNQIAVRVTAKLQEVADKTKQKIQEMNPELANSLSPVIPSTADLKWPDVFKNVSITGDNDIPLNKRGSGIRRLILLNFFRAQAEELLQSASTSNIVYAIEEPETSQHYNSQIQLINALKELAAKDGVQVLITTHSATVVKELSFNNIRLIEKTDKTNVVKSPQPQSMPYPSLNEINFIAFDMPTEEYHDELYGYLKSKKNEATGETWLKEFYRDKAKYPYTKDCSNGGKQPMQLTKTEIIRNQIHHPDNPYQEKFSIEEMENSIKDMRNFIIEKHSNK